MIDDRIGDASIATLRDIAWSIWNPIPYLRDIGWDQDGSDEYDSYLLEAVSMIRSGKNAEQVVHYLMHSETVTMLQDYEIYNDDRAKATVAAIIAHLDELSGKHVSTKPETSR
jgi:hypothetical protein